MCLPSPSTCTLHHLLCSATTTLTSSPSTLVHPATSTPATVKGETQGQPTLAPATVTQVEGELEAVEELVGQSRESAMVWWIQGRLVVTRWATEGAPAWQPSTPQLTTPMARWLAPSFRTTAPPESPCTVGWGTHVAGGVDGLGPPGKTHHVGCNVAPEGPLAGGVGPYPDPHLLAGGNAAWD